MKPKIFKRTKRSDKNIKKLKIYLSKSEGNVRKNNN